MEQNPKLPYREVDLTDGELALVVLLRSLSPERRAVVIRLAQTEPEA